MNITSLQVTDSAVIINGIEYAPKAEVDLDYLNELEQENAYLRDVLAGLGISVDAFENSISRHIKEIRDSLSFSDSKPTTVVSPDSGFTINDLLDDLRNEEDKQPEKIIVRNGTYNYPIDLSGIQDLTLVFEGVEINGLRKAEWEWVATGDNSFVGYFPGYEGLWTWQDDDSRGDFNNTKMYPVLTMIGDEPLMWHSSLESLQAHEEGFYMNIEPNEPGDIFVYLKPGQSIEDFVFSPYDRLFYGDDGTKNITIEGQVTFRGCSNTGKTGAVNFPGSGWDTTKAIISVSHVNTIGIEFGQGGTRSNMKNHVTDSSFGTLISYMAGQMGFWGMAKRCTANHLRHERSNWKGFDPWWEASNKFEGCEDFLIDLFEGIDCNGQGEWWDISNKNCRVNKSVFRNVMLAGLMVEHHGYNNSFPIVEVDGVSVAKFDPNTSWNVTAGILCQSSVQGNEFGVGGHIIVKNAEDAIRINNEDFRDRKDDGTFNATTTNNTFKNLSYEGVTDPPVRVIGNMAGNTID